MSRLLACATFLAACGTSEEAAPTTDLGPDSAEVTVSSAAGSMTHRWSRDDGNFLRCQESSRTFFIRLAMADGEDAVHVDFDICHFHGTGHYDGLDPFVTDCVDGGASFFDVFWHEAHQASTHVNFAGSTDCSLDLTQSGDALDGSFRCKGLEIPTTQIPSLDLEGAFRCAHAL